MPRLRCRQLLYWALLVTELVTHTWLTKLPSKMKVLLCGPKLQSGGIHDIYLPMLLQSVNSHLIMILHNYLEISRIFGHMMQVFPPVWKWSNYAIVEALHPTSMSYLKELWRAYGSTLITLYHRGFPRFGKVLWNHIWCKCGNDPTTLSLRR